MEGCSSRGATVSFTALLEASAPSSTTRGISTVFLTSLFSADSLAFFFFFNIAIETALLTFSIPSLDCSNSLLSSKRRLRTWVSSVPLTRESSLAISWWRESSLAFASLRWASRRWGSEAIAAASLKKRGGTIQGQQAALLGSMVKRNMKRAVERWVRNTVLFGFLDGRESSTGQVSTWIRILSLYGNLMKRGKTITKERLEINDIIQGWGQRDNNLLRTHSTTSSSKLWTKTTLSTQDFGNQTKLNEARSILTWVQWLKLTWGWGLDRATGCSGERLMLDWKERSEKMRKERDGSRRG